MPYTVELPDGRSVEFPDSVPKEKAAEIIRTQLGIGEGKKGFGAALGKGFESALSSGRAGLAGLIGSPEEAAAAGLERGKRINTEYADQIGLDKVKEAYGRGVLPAVGEVARQVPLAFAEQFPNLAAMAGSARAGAMAGARLGPYGGIAGGIAGALAPSALQQFGGNIETQAAEQEAAGKPISIDRDAALAATAVQAPLDVLGTYIPLGGRLVSKLVGIPEKALLKDATGKAAKLAEERLLTTLAKGTGKGVLAEVPTEVAQQMLERAQAGMPLTNEEALSEYGETAYRTSLLGPLGAVGRLSERGGARMEVEKQKQEEKRQAQIAQAEQEEQLAQQKQAVEAAAAAQRQTPQFAQEADAKYIALQKQVEDLLAASKATVDPTDLAGIAAKKEAQQKLKDLKASDEYKQTIADWRETAPIRAKMQADKDAAAAAQAAAQQQQADAAAAAAAQQQAAAAQRQAAQMQQEEFAGPFRQPMLPGMEGVEPPAQATAPSEDTASDLAQRQQQLERILADAKEKERLAAASGDVDALVAAKKTTALIDNENTYVTKQLELMGGSLVPGAEANTIKQALDKAKTALMENAQSDAYDSVFADKQLVKIQKLTDQLKRLLADPNKPVPTDLEQLAIPEEMGVQQTLDLGRPKNLKPGETEEEFNARMAPERERQAKVGAETEALQRIGQRPVPESEKFRYQLEPVFGRDEQDNSAALGQMQQDLSMQPELAALRRKAQAIERAYVAESEKSDKNPAKVKRLKEMMDAAYAELQEKYQAGRTVTGEADKELKTARRVAGTGEFKLTSFQTPAKGRTSYEDLQQRLAQLLVRNDLSPEAYDLLRDAEQYLPTSDVSVTTEATPGMKPGVQFLTAAQEDRIARRKEAIKKMQKELDAAKEKAGIPKLEEKLQAVKDAIKKIDTQLKRTSDSGKIEALKKQRDAAETTYETIKSALENANNSQRLKNLQKPLEYSKQLLANEESLSRPMKPGATAGESFYSLLDRQLTQIESGQEGIDTRKQPKYREFTREGIPALETRARTAEGERITTEKTPVQERKVARRRTKNTLFSANEAPALSLQADLEELIDRAKYGREDTAVEQGDLFKAQPKETGYVKEDRAAFERLQKSPFVRKYFAQLVAADRAEADAKKRLEALRPQIEEISKKLTALTDAQNLGTKATEAGRNLTKISGELPLLAQDLAKTAENMTQGVVERMQIRGLIDDLLLERNQKIRSVEARKYLTTQEQTLLLAEIDRTVARLREVEAEMAYAELALAVQQANLTVAHGKQKLEQTLGELGSFRAMSRLWDLPAKIAKAQKELTTARTDAAKAEGDLKKALIDREESNKDPEAAANKVKARAAEVIAAAERAAKREAEIAEENRRIQEVNSEEGKQYTAIEESERFRREAKNRGDLPVITAADQQQIIFREEESIRKGSRSPLKVLGGYRSRIAALEKTIQRERARTRQYIFAEIEPLKQAYEKLKAAHEAEKDGAVRAQILPDLIKADAAYQEAYRLASKKPLTFKGQAKVFAELEQAYIKDEWLSNLIQEGKLPVGLEREKVVKLTPKEKKAAQVARQKEVDANKQAALEEGEAPATGGENLTLFQIAARRKQQDTLYQSKGADYTTLENERRSKKEDVKISLRPAEGVSRSVLDELVTKRLDIADIDRALEYIEKNPSTSVEGKERQATAKKDLLARRKVANKERIELSKQQQKVVSALKAPESLKKKDTAAEQGYNKLKGVKAAGKEAVVGEEIVAGNEERPAEIVVEGKYRTVEGQAPVTPMPAAELNKLIASVERSLKGKANIIVLDSVTDIDPKQKAGTRAGALINGQLYLFRDGIADGVEGMKTIYHELFHKGLANLMDRNEYTALMNKLYDQSADIRGSAQSWYKKHVDDVEAYRKDYVEKNPGLSDSALDDATRAHIVEEVLADMAETRKPPGLLQQMRNWFASIAERFGMSELAKQIRGMDPSPLQQLIDDALSASVRGNVTDNRTLFRSTATYANDTLASAGAIGDKFIAKNQTLFDNLKANNAGLAFETKIVDRFAGFERLSKTMPALKGTQMMYYLRMYDQRMNFVAQSVSRGALQRVEKTRPDGGKEFLIESKEGPSLKGVVETLKEAKKMVGSGQGVNRLFTLYLSAIRAQDKGLAALHFGTALTQADLDQAMKAIAATPGLKAIFDRARAEYNQYNKGLINFAVQAGAIKKDVAAELLKQNDYIPWYRQRNGVAEMVIGNETPISVGSIASQPYLQELVGGDTAILDFMTSSVQNTNLLTDMALRNLATKNSVMELVAMKLAKIGSKNMAGPNVVKFRQDGEDVAAMIDTDTVGIDADILVKGMEGIPVQLSGLGRLLAFPATILRKTITVSPLYIAKQLFRDSLAAPILSGADFTPVMGALKEINGAAKDTLERRGITGGQIFTGGSEDLTKILQDIADDKTSWTQAVSKLQAVSMEADALTRRAQYNSYIKQGLSEMEATLMSLESMNFNRKGLSPSVRAHPPD